jgi:DHA1 family bicyclomycin/chloramphenicol resistance-like MFS transporter
MKKVPMWIALIAIAPLVIALPVAMDIYTPAIPSITRLFHTNTATMQLTLNLFMLMSGLAQVIVGPLADRFGRRWTTFYLILIFSIGIYFCSFAHSISLLIFGRLIEAIGSCGMLTLGFTVGRDLYTGKPLAQLYSILNGIISFSPMLAPFVGSYLDLKWGWVSTFEILWVISALSVICYYGLVGETWPKSARTALNGQIIKDNWMILKNAVFGTYTLSSAIGMSYLFIFCATSPVILMQLLHVPESHYGFYFCFMGISFFIGSFLSVAIISKFGIYKTVVIGYVVTLIGGITMLVWYDLTGLTIYCFIIPMLLIGMGGTFCLSGGSAGAVIPFDAHVGIASALCTAVRFLFSAILGLLIAHSIHSVLPLAVPATLFSLIGLTMVYQKKNAMQSINEAH